MIGSLENGGKSEKAKSAPHRVEHPLINESEAQTHPIPMIANDLAISMSNSSFMSSGPSSVCRFLTPG